MTKGSELGTFIIGLNGNADIDSTLLNVLVNIAKIILETERPWMVLRKSYTNFTSQSGNTWQTAYDLSVIPRFSKFYGELPVRLFDGNNRVEYYRQVPFDRRLEYKNVSNTFTYDENAKILYFNGVLPFVGQIYINYVEFSQDIDVDNDTDLIWTQFPSQFIPLLGFYTIGIHMGAIDYDTITARQAPQNFAIMNTLKNALEAWDNDRQLSAIENNDPGELYNFPRSGAIDRTGSPMQ